jgi:DNA-binding MurR/RpiR family transcriptional regulator
LLNSIDNDILNTLTQSELSVLQYIDNNSSEVLKMSIHELSEKVFFSTATILRLCKKLNFSGYAELKFALKNSTSSQDLVMDNPVSDETIFNDLYAQIENTSRLLDTKNIEKVVNYLLSDKKIHLYSTGITTIVFEYMQRYLLATERSSTLYKADKLAFHAAQNLTDNDVLILASTTGLDPSILKVARIAKSNNVPIIAIAPLTNNQLSQLADITLYFFAKDRNYSNSDIKNRTSIFYIIDMIVQHYLYNLNIADSIYSNQ